MNLQSNTAVYLGLTLRELSKGSNKVFLLVSGGSCFEVLENIESTCWNKNITIGMIDERYSDDPNINNFCQLRSLLCWPNIARANCGVINTEIKKGETLGAEAARMERQWKGWKKHNKKGKIIVLLGMGKDGHTAGIMPMVNDEEKFKKLFLDDKVWVVGYDCEDKNIYRYRMTATLNFLKNIANEVVVYVNGEEKMEKWNEIENGNTKINELPIKIIKEISKVNKFVNTGI